jgi:Bacterial protein of unknown function (DUF937)
MNLVKSITDQLSSDAMAKLCSTLGVDGESIESAVAVAVPSVLAGLGRLATDEEGIHTLTRTLGGLDDSMFGNFDRMLSGDTTAIVQKGRTLWSGLFGEGLQSNLATAINRFTGISPTTAVSLLEYLTPLVFGRVASQWRNQGGTPEALKRLFDSQQRFIADALPSGFSLSDIRELPQMSGARSPATKPTEAPRVAAKFLNGSLIPLALAIATVVLLWSYLRNRVQPQEAGVRPALEATDKVVVMKPVAPAPMSAGDASQRGRQETDFFEALGMSLSGIEAAPAALAALPRLKVLERQIDELGLASSRLPSDGRIALNASLKKQVEEAKRHAHEVLALPGLNDRLQSLILEIVDKLDKLSAAEPTT